MSERVSKWSALSVGVPELDEEHLDFVALCRALDDAGEASPAEVALAVQRLVRGALTHMRHEEQLLIGSGFSQHCAHAFRAHVREHGRIRHRLREMAQVAETGRFDAALMVDMQNSHILQCDIKLKAFLVEITSTSRYGSAG